MQRGAADPIRVTSVLGIGELLWDLLPAGPRLGGAPFNATVHLSRLGFDASFLTAVGDDDLGRRALDEVRSLGVATALIGVTPDVPTGTVGVEIDKSRPSDLRDPRAGCLRPRRARHRRAHRAVGDGARRHRVRDTGPALRGGARSDPLRACRVALGDACLRREPSRGLVDTDARRRAAPRRDGPEVERHRGRRARGGSRPPGKPRRVRARRRRAVRHPARVRHRRSPRARPPGQREGRTSVAGHDVAIADTVGAGDAFTAGLVGSLLDGADVAEALRVGNALGALVASRPGATPLWTVEELDALLALPDSGQATRR